MKVLNTNIICVLLMLLDVAGPIGGCNPHHDSHEQDPVTPILTSTEMESHIDDSYTASFSDIQQTWVSEYAGWDENQQKNTKIKRLLVLKPNKTYSNVIQGILVESGKDKYTDFEHEQGTYSYNSNSKTITYTVTYDSILNYRDQSFDKYNGKKFYSHTDGNYTEKVSFSKERNGQRSWISHDTYLQSLTDKTINIAFAMVVNR